jgi:hypothetical protein
MSLAVKSEDYFKRVTRSASRRNEAETASYASEHPQSKAVEPNPLYFDTHQQHSVYLDYDQDVIMSDRDECPICCTKMESAWTDG